MPQSADYTYDREADCFVVTDASGNELVRTRSPHRADDKTMASFLSNWINQGLLIFPTTGDTPPLHVG